MLLAVLVSAPLYAGLWDIDRPAESPAAYDVIGGRFDEFPRAYYESRYQRVRPVIEAAAKLAENPDSTIADRAADALSAFDDASVAHLRTGQFTEAIILLDSKSHLMALIRRERAATVRQHQARYVANKASCLHHRWNAGATPDAGDLRLAAELLRDLLKEDQYDSDARWSLREVEWLLVAPHFVSGADPVFPNMLGLRDAAFRNTLDDTALIQAGIGGCLPWLARRIAYEGGWRDVDVMYAYSLALYLSGRTEESLFAWFRVCELIDAGVRTRVSNAPAPGALKRALGVHLESVANQPDARAVYSELRQRADAWRASRTEYVTAQLKLGRHPDTHADFWSDWKLAEPTQPADSPPVSSGVSPALLLGGFGGLLVLLVLILGVTLRVSRRGTAPHLDEL